MPKGKSLIKRYYKKKLIKKTLKQKKKSNRYYQKSKKKKNKNKKILQTRGEILYYEDYEDYDISGKSIKFVLKKNNQEWLSAYMKYYLESRPQSSQDEIREYMSELKEYLHDDEKWKAYLEKKKKNERSIYSCR